MKKVAPLHPPVLNPNQKIFDLWHGTVLFPEGALQLLLIIDYLCDWACEVYRESVMRCLTGGASNLLKNRLSPIGTDTSSLAGDPELTALRVMSLPSRSFLAPDLSIDQMIGLAGTSSPKFLKIEPLVKISTAALPEREDAHNWGRWATTEQDSLPWAQRATIRHSNRVELSYLQVSMPEENRLLQTCLDSCFPSLSIMDAAKKLLISLEDDNLAVTTSVKATSWQGNQQEELILPVRALVYFRSALRPEDWQITRQVLCILCSEKAIQGLAEIAHYRPYIPRSPKNNDDAQCERFLLAINSLNLIGGTRSAGLALLRRQLSLRAVGDNPRSSDFEWSKFSPQRNDGFKGAEFHGIMSHALQHQEVSIQNHLKPYVEKNSCLCVVPAGSDQNGPPATALEIPNFRTQGVLIKKPKGGWGETAQNLCFLVMNENVWFDNESMLGQLMDESNKAREVFAMANTNAAYEHGDRAIIDKWILILKGELSHYTALE